MGVASGHASVALTLLTVRFALSAPVPSCQLRAAAIDAHPVGTPVSTIIEFGDPYLGNRLYNAKITVLEIVRGEKAWNRVKQAGRLNRPPESGFEYLLARVRFEFWARTMPAEDRYSVNENQFTAVTRDSQEFDAPILAVSPQPRLRGTLKPGDSLEGWLVFLVPQRLSEPVMVFREDVGSVSHTGGGTWFELYVRPIAGPKPKP
jgi:hypothetical protein